MHEIASEIERELQTRETGWNMGSFGVIAEFHHVAGDRIPRGDSRLTISTHRGGARFCNLDEVRPVAFESLSAKQHRWTQGVALCLPHQDALMHSRQSLTELGPDEEAIRAHDKTAILFDMG